MRFWFVVVWGIACRQAPVEPLCDRRPCPTYDELLAQAVSDCDKAALYLGTCGDWRFIQQAGPFTSRVAYFDALGTLRTFRTTSDMVFDADSVASNAESNARSSAGVHNCQPMPSGAFCSPTEYAGYWEVVTNQDTTVRVAGRTAAVRYVGNETAQFVVPAIRGWQLIEVEQRVSGIVLAANIDQRFPLRSALVVGLSTGATVITSDGESARVPVTDDGHLGFTLVPTRPSGAFPSPQISLRGYNVHSPFLGGAAAAAQ